jgi:hypothetical protein
MVSTLKYKQDSTSVDLKKSLEVSLQTLESKGKKYDCEKEDFETTENITGIKGYGTFRVNDKSVGREKYITK